MENELVLSKVPFSRSFSSPHDIYEIPYDPKTTLVRPIFLRSREDSNLDKLEILRTTPLETIEEENEETDCNSVCISDSPRSSTSSARFLPFEIDSDIDSDDESTEDPLTAVEKLALARKNIRDITLSSFSGLTILNPGDEIPKRFAADKEEMINRAFRRAPKRLAEFNGVLKKGTTLRTGWTPDTPADPADEQKRSRRRRKYVEVEMISPRSLLFKTLIRCTELANVPYQNASDSDSSEDEDEEEEDEDDGGVDIIPAHEDDDEDVDEALQSLLELLSLKE